MDEPFITDAAKAQDAHKPEAQEEVLVLEANEWRPPGENVIYVNELEQADAVDKDVESKEDSKLKKIAKSTGALALGVVALGSWVFEVGPWNETARVNLGTEVLVRTLSEFRTAGAVGAFTLGIELASSGLVIAGLNTKNMPGRRAIEWLSNKITSSKEDDTESSGRAKAADTSLAIAVGAAVSSAKRHVAEPELTVKDEFKSAALDSSAVAAFSTTVAFILSGGIRHAETIQGYIDGFGDEVLEPVIDFTYPDSVAPYVQPLTDKIYLEEWARWFADHGTDSKIWMGLFGALWLSDSSNRDMISQGIKTKLGTKNVPTYGRKSKEDEFDSLGEQD